MPKQIVPNLWFDTAANEAAELYISLFDHSRMVGVSKLHGTPSGDVDIVDFELAGQPFEAISAGPLFKFNPSHSLTVACESVEEIDRLWAALSEGGAVLMPLDAYPFSPRYGWLADRYGLNWQLTLSVENTTGVKITPSMLFSADATGFAEEAARFYAEVFPGSAVSFVSHYAAGEAESVRAKANYIAFQLHGQPFIAMDNGFDVDYTFSEAFSLMVFCDTQEEIDAYWAKLSHVPEAESCGWLKDRYGVSWQIVPRALNDMLSQGSDEQVRRVTEALLPMGKLDIAALKQAFDGR